LSAHETHPSGGWRRSTAGADDNSQRIVDGVDLDGTPNEAGRTGKGEPERARPDMLTLCRRLGGRGGRDEKAASRRKSTIASGC
jgi:hypothetical protein